LLKVTDDSDNHLCEVNGLDYYKSAQGIDFEDYQSFPIYNGLEFI